MVTSGHPCLTINQINNYQFNGFERLCAVEITENINYNLLQTTEMLNYNLLKVEIVEKFNKSTNMASPSIMMSTPAARICEEVLFRPWSREDDNFSRWIILPIFFVFTSKAAASQKLSGSQPGLNPASAVRVGGGNYDKEKIIQRSL